MSAFKVELHGPQYIQKPLFNVVAGFDIAEFGYRTREHHSVRRIQIVDIFNGQKMQAQYTIANWIRATYITERSPLPRDEEAKPRHHAGPSSTRAWGN